MAVQLLLVLFLVSSTHTQINYGDWKFLISTYDTRAKAIEEMTKRAAVIQNQKNQAAELAQTATIQTIPPPILPTAPGGVVINKRPTLEDDLIFLKRMKEESEVYERSTREGTNPDFLTSIPAPPYIPYKPMPFFFAPNPQLFPLPGSRIFARPSSLVMEKQPRQQLPLRGIYYR